MSFLIFLALNLIFLVHKACSTAALLMLHDDGGHNAIGPIKIKYVLHLYAKQQTNGENQNEVTTCILHVIYC